MSLSLGDLWTKVTCLAESRDYVQTAGLKAHLKIYITYIRSLGRYIYPRGLTIEGTRHVHLRADPEADPGLAGDIMSLFWPWESPEKSWWK